MKQRVIYVHPEGRFKVVERLVGAGTWIREAIPLPPDPSRYVPREYQEPRQLSHQTKKEFDGAQILTLFQKGHSIEQICKETGFSLWKVRTTLRAFEEMMEWPEKVRLYLQLEGCEET